MPVLVDQMVWCASHAAHCRGFRLRDTRVAQFARHGLIQAFACPVVQSYWQRGRTSLFFSVVPLEKPGSTYLAFSRYGSRRMPAMPVLRALPTQVVIVAHHGAQGHVAPAQRL